MQKHAGEFESPIYLGLGSNLGDRASSLAEAITRIESLGVEIARSSSIYESEPVGYKDQPWFLNQAIEVGVSAGRRSRSPSELLQALLGIETAMGRTRGIPKGPRLIDIDLLMFGQRAGSFPAPGVPAASKAEGASDSFLVLPHPRMHQRRFVLAPLCEIAPGLIHPVLEISICDLLRVVEDSSVVRLFGVR